MAPAAGEQKVIFSRRGEIPDSKFRGLAQHFGPGTHLTSTCRSLTDEGDLTKSRR